MKLKQITVPIENSPGRLYEFTRALGENGIDLKALNLVDTGNFGELRIMVSDEASARQILMQKDIPGRVDDVVAVEIEGKFGDLSHLIESLMKAGISIKYTYTVKGVSPGKSIIIFCGRPARRDLFPWRARSGKKESMPLWQETSRRYII